MKKTLNNLYGDFFSGGLSKPEDNSPKEKKTNKKMDTSEIAKKLEEVKATHKTLNKDDTQKMLDDLDRLSDEMNHLLSGKQESLNAQIASTFNEVPENTNLSTTYVDLEELIKPVVIGQDSAISQMNTAFKRPFFKNPFSPILNTILLCGPKGSGKHTLIEAYNAQLYANNILKYAKPTYIDLAVVQDQNVFIQDLYSALYKDHGIVVFENVDMASSVFVSLLNDLCTDGSLTLKQRFTLQNNKLTNASNTLDANLVDSITCKQHYLIFLSNLSLKKAKEKLGNQFLSHIGEEIETTKLDVPSRLTILKKDLAVFENSIKGHYNVTLHFDKEALMCLVNKYYQNNGYYDIKATIEKLEKELSTYFFTNRNITDVTITCINDFLAINENTIFLKEVSLDEELASIQKEMDEIVGLKEVKEYIYALKDMAAIRKRRIEQGLKGADISMHMIFTGNPGTGKTTMARLMARYLKALGILKNGQLVEVTRADLVAQYVGQTAPKTKAVIESSLGGVLFIDEAYSLYRGKEDSFGLEAIDMLVKGMEDYRDDFLVVLAGYTKEMATFLEANSGLKSRFPNTMEFPDYTAQELYDIALINAKSKEYKVDEAVREPLLAYFDKIQHESAARSGNGRLSRNVIEDAILHQARRVATDPDADLTLLIKEDFDVLE